MTSEERLLRAAFDLYVRFPSYQAAVAVRKAMELYEHASASTDHDRHVVLAREAAAALQLVVDARKDTPINEVKS